jgi:hypothetical protein
VIALPLVLLLIAVRQPAPTGTQAPGTTPAPAATLAPGTPAPATPLASPLPAPTAPNASGATAAPTATMTAPAPATPSAPPAERATALPYGYRYVPRQPENVATGQPQIFAVYLNSNKLKSLGPIDIKVATSPDVVKVMTVSNGRESAIPMIGPGDFEAVGKLPKLPIIASGVSTILNFVAIGASGKRVTVPVPVQLQ